MTSNITKKNTYRVVIQALIIHLLETLPMPVCFSIAIKI